MITKDRKIQLRYNAYVTLELTKGFYSDSNAYKELVNQANAVMELTTDVSEETRLYILQKQ